MLAELLIHTLNHYDVSHAKGTSGADNNTFPTATNSNVPCFFAQEVSETNQKFGSNKEVKRGFCYLADSTVYAAVSLEDRIVIDSVKFRVTGKQNPCGKNVLFVFNLIQDVSGVT